VPFALRKLFGEKSTVLYGFLFTYTSVTSLLQLGLQALLLTSEEESFTIMFFIDGGLSVVALLILLLFFKEIPYKP
jgi:hypothetical protein